MEKALSEPSETQSLQSHVGSFIRFRNGEFPLTAVVYLFSKSRLEYNLTRMLKRRRVHVQKQRWAT